MRLKQAAVIVLTAGLGLGATACGGSSDGGGSGGSGDGGGGRDGAARSSLVVNSATKPASLDPATACNLSDIALISDLYVTLVKHGSKPGPDGTEQEDTTKVEPYLATEWTTSNDGKTYTFKLDPKAKFPSGKPIDAKAVKYSFDRAVKMGSCGFFFANAQEPDPALLDSVKAVDAQTVEFTLTRKNASWLHAMTSPVLGIVDPSVVEQHGGVSKKPNEWMASHATGGGPYVLESYQPGRKAVYAANKTFFGEQPKVPRVEINFISADPTLLLQARSGKADLTLGLSAQSLSTLKKNPSSKVVSTPAVASQFISFPTQMKPFDNAKLREALTYAVPYEDLVDKVLFGFGKSYYGPFAPAAPEANADLQQPRAYDMEKAKQLIADSGVKTPVTLPVYTQEGQTDAQKIATIIQDSWGQLGVKVKIKQLPPAEFQNAVAAKDKKYTLIRFDGPAVPNALWQVSYDMFCASPFNISQYCNEEVEKLALEAIAAVDDEQGRQQALDDLAKAWIKDSPRVPAYQQNYTVAMKKDLEGYRFGQADLFLHRLR